MTEARMQEAPEYAPGTFCWIDLGTTDAEAAKKFYNQLFGWESTDNPVSPEMVYSMLTLNGKEVGALYQMPAEMTSQGIPPHWLSYVSVVNADESAEQAKSLGATVVKEPFDVFDVGRMAIIQDPAGAGFAIWQPLKHPGAAVVNVPNSFCWNELATTDAVKAGDFYANFFGWARDVQSFGPMEYTMFTNGGRPAGGMFVIMPEMGNVPPHWLVYFAVDDCDAKTQKAAELGATTVKPPDDIPGIGRFSILQDPQGAFFAIIKLDNPDT